MPIGPVARVCWLRKIRKVVSDYKLIFGRKSWCDQTRGSAII